MTNSRVKDYLDLWVMLDRESLNIDTLAQAISATFSRRGMLVPANMPMGLSDEFAADPTRQALWAAFAKKNDLAMIPLDVVVTRIRSAIEPAMLLAARVTAT